VQASHSLGARDNDASATVICLMEVHSFSQSLSHSFIHSFMDRAGGETAASWLLGAGLQEWLVASRRAVFAGKRAAPRTPRPAREQQQQQQAEQQARDGEAAAGVESEPRASIELELELALEREREHGLVQARRELSERLGSWELGATKHGSRTLRRRAGIVLRQ
jgi:hypothetical protein